MADRMRVDEITPLAICQGWHHMDGIAQSFPDFRQTGGISLPTASQGGVVADDKLAQFQYLGELAHERSGSLVCQGAVERLSNNRIHAERS